jgi:polar amino acid transport system substrate-binding protein
MLKLIGSALLAMAFALPAFAQDLTVSTVTRAPFSIVENSADTGFSIELWRAVAKDLGRDFQLIRHDSFGEMLEAVKSGSSDAAIANISITSQRELEMDFTHPIFASGLRTMIQRQSISNFSIIWSLASWDLFFAVMLAFGLLLIGGMLMWFFEREKQEYFDRPASKAVFPAFWWALNLVVNGGFEERIPRSFMGRIFGVLLVISSLFIVSIFVARITAAMTVSAIESSVSSVNDLYGKSVGTVTGSTAELFLDSRDIRAQGYEGFQALVQAFEAKDIDAVVFDSPILAYYVNTDGAKIAELAGPIFQQENYGIALPTGSSLNEPINQSLLKLRENGTYATLYRKWFGETP